jgi:hypothetical protein
MQQSVYAQWHVLQPGWWGESKDSVQRIAESKTAEGLQVTRIAKTCYDKNKGMFEAKMTDPYKDTPDEIKPHTELPMQSEGLSRIQSEPCYCIGCGSSIKGMDFSLLRPYYTIGTNYIMRDYPVKCGVILDPANFLDEIPASVELWLHKRAIPDDYTHPRLHVIETSLNNVNTDPADPSWVIGHLSGLAAINIAYLKGYREIYLLGYDMQGSNYYDNGEVIFARNNKLAYKFARFVETDAKIYNCNPDSWLEVFPKVKDHPATGALAHTSE